MYIYISIVFSRLCCYKQISEYLCTSQFEHTTFIKERSGNQWYKKIIVSYILPCRIHGYCENGEKKNGKCTAKLYGIDDRWYPRF